MKIFILMNIIFLQYLDARKWHLETRIELLTQNHVDLWLDLTNKPHALIKLIFDHATYLTMELIGN